MPRVWESRIEIEVAGTSRTWFWGRRRRRRSGGMVCFPIEVSRFTPLRVSPWGMLRLRQGYWWSPELAQVPNARHYTF